MGKWGLMCTILDVYPRRQASTKLLVRISPGGTFTYIYTHMCIYIYVCMYIYNIYIYMCVCVYIYLHIHTYLCVCVKLYLELIYISLYIPMCWFHIAYPMTQLCLSTHSATSDVCGVDWCWLLYSPCSAANIFFRRKKKNMAHVPIYYIPSGNFDIAMKNDPCVSMICLLTVTIWGCKKFPEGIGWWNPHVPTSLNAQPPWRQACRNLPYLSGGHERCLSYVSWPLRLNAFWQSYITIS